MKLLLMGIDIGTSTIKTSLFTLEGEEVSSYKMEYPFYCPNPGWVEQDPIDWWTGTKETIKRVVLQSKVSPHSIAGIGISSQSWGVVPIDKNGNVLRPALLWMDRRAVKQSKKIEEYLLNQGMNFNVDPSYIVPKILWIKDNEFDIYKKTNYFLQVNSYINYRLSGEISMDLSQEDPLQIFIRNKGKSDNLNDFYESIGISSKKMPPCQSSFNIIGKISSMAAEETGLALGTPLIAGAMDTSASALGAGVNCSGQSFHAAGQAGAIGVCLDRPVFDRRICIHNHVLHNRWLVAGVMVATGASLRWFRDQIGIQEQILADQLDLDPFELLCLEAEKSKAGSGGLIFLPYMMGERTPMWDYNARGVYFGLNLNTKRTDLIRAILEGCSYALRHNIEVLSSIGVKMDDEIVGAGGAIKGDFWNQMKADITKKKIVHVENFNDPVTWGASILVGIGLGIFSEPIKFERIFQKRKVYLPDEDTFKMYDPMYEIYKNLYSDLKADFDDLAKIQSTKERLKNE